MDALSDALRVMGLTGGVFLEARFTAPWCVVGRVDADNCKPYLSTPSHVICFHYVAEGRCRARTADQPPCELVAGDVVLLSRNDTHLLGSDLNRPPV